MMPARAVCPDAVLVRPLGAHAWWVRLPNTHELAGIVRRADRERAAGLAPGQVVAIEIVPADFSRGRLHFPGSADPMMAGTETVGALARSLSGAEADGTAGKPG